MADSLPVELLDRVPEPKRHETLVVALVCATVAVIVLGRTLRRQDLPLNPPSTPSSMAPLPETVNVDPGFIDSPEPPEENATHESEAALADHLAVLEVAISSATLLVDSLHEELRRQAGEIDRLSQLIVVKDEEIDRLEATIGDLESENARSIGAGVRATLTPSSSRVPQDIEAHTAPPNPRAVQRSSEHGGDGDHDGRSIDVSAVWNVTAPPSFRMSGRRRSRYAVMNGSCPSNSTRTTSDDADKQRTWAVEFERQRRRFDRGATMLYDMEVTAGKRSYGYGHHSH